MTDFFDFAHGLGGQKDLPIPLGLTVTGAVAALVISFAVLGVAWRTPRYTPDRFGWRVERVQRVVEHRAFAIGLRTFGMALFLFTAFAAIFGNNSTINPFLGIFYVWLWVGIVPASLLFGPFWKAISPVRTINALFAKIARTDPRQGLYRYPERLGYWPAALGLFAFVWLELVYPFMAEVPSARLWCAIYVALMLLGGALFGSDFYEHGDPFEVYSTLVSRLSPWHYRDEVLFLRSPLANVASMPVGPGLIGVVGILFGSTAYDSFREAPVWVRFVQGSDINGRVLGNLGLLTFCLAAIGILMAASVAVSLWTDREARDLPAIFAPSLVPIVVGYVFAHYLTYLVEIGSRTLILASDPLSRGQNLFGTADWSDITWWSYHPTLLASVKVLGVVIGHVLAAIVAHDRAIAVLPKRSHLTGQLPMLFAMVGFTVGGLYLLFSA